MIRPGTVLISLRPGERFEHVPSHIDWMIGAVRRVSRLDGGGLDRLLRERGGGFRVVGVYHARRSLGRVGEQHSLFDEIEEALGMSRTYRIEIVEGDDQALVSELREHPLVERAWRQRLAFAPCSLPAAAAWAPSGGAPKPIDNRTLTVADASAAYGEAERQHEQVHARQALRAEPGDERVIVGIADTGVSLGHPELRARLLAGYNTVDLGMGGLGGNLRLVGDSRGPDFTPLDRVGHGSHCAGVIGALGLRLPPGIAGRSLLLPIRVLAAAESESTHRRIGVGALDNIDAGIKIAIDYGARVLNLSLGTGADHLDPGAPLPHQAVARYAARYDCILVAAAGNSGKEERFYPAALPEVIAVGALDESCTRRAEFSTYGNHVDLYAPGERIISIGMHNYRRSSGTSHAAPFVTGACALIAAAAGRRGRRINGAEARRILSFSARRIENPESPTATGHGLLNIASALSHLEAIMSREPAFGTAARREAKPECSIR